MQSRRSILTAAAVMTLHAMALSTLAPQPAHGNKVYRCAGPQHHVRYQAQPCADTGGATKALREREISVADARTEAQVRQALDNRRRDGFDAEPAETTRPTSRRARKKASDALEQEVAAKAPKAKARKRARTKLTRRTPSADRAGALTSHRLGERPFEHVGTPLSDAEPPRRKGKARDKREREHVRAKDFTARAPTDEPTIRGKVPN